MNNWNETIISSVCELIAGFAFKSMDFGAYPDKTIKITNITPPCVDMNNLIGVDMQKYNKRKLTRFLAHKGDYIFAMTGATIGKIGRIEDGEAYINQRVLMFRPDSEKIDKDFFYYVLNCKSFQQYVMNHIDSESAQPNISASTVGKYSFRIPPLGIQQAIGHVLRLLDEKIENNKRINHHLPPPISDTDNSPDIKRGKSVSRSSARRRHSMRLFTTCSYSGARIVPNRRYSSTFGIRTSAFSNASRFICPMVVALSAAIATKRAR